MAIDYGTKYCSDFVNSTRITDEQTPKSKWEICKTHRDENYGNGHFRIEILDIESGEKLTENDWIFDKIECSYSWNNCWQTIVMIDPCGNEARIHWDRYGGSTKSYFFARNENLHEIIIDAVKKFRDISTLNYADEGKMIECDITHYDLVQLIEWYDKVSRFKKRLSTNAQENIDKKFISQLKDINKKLLKSQSSNEN